MIACTRRAAYPVLCCVLAAAACGCTGGDTGKARAKMVPVSGKVIYKGQPVEGAVVTFMSEAAPRTATGKTDAAGAFKLTTYDTNDGAVAGEHKVSISKAAAGGDAKPMSPEDYAKFMSGSGGKPPQQEVSDAIPAKYASPETSGLTRTVVDGDVNEFTFELD